MPLRRSRRERKANTRYTNDGWDEKTLQILRESSESPGSSRSLADKDAGVSDSDSADGFIAEEDNEDGLDGESGEDLGLTLAATSEPDKRTSVLNTGYHDARFPSGRFRSHREPLTDADYFATFGSSAEDLIPVLHARNHWGKGRDITLPSRGTLQDPETSFEAVWPEKPAVGSSIDLRALDTRQESVQLDKIQVNAPVPDHSILLGPSKQQQVFKLKPNEPIEAVHVRTAPETNAGNALAQAVAPSAASSNQGWILHTGRKISGISWVPKSYGDQYLAISSNATASERASVPSSASERPSAFRPSSSWPSSIHIWRFASKTDIEQPSPRLDMKRPPLLVKTIEIECGDIRQLAWSPLLSTDDFRLLAVVSSDGRVRVIVECEAFSEALTAEALDLDPTPSRVQVTRPALDLHSPESTVFTAVAWASPTDLAVGASDGSLGLYNIQKPAEDHTYEPYLTYQLHTTYLLSLSVSYPSSVPFYIASSSTSGDLLLTDLRAPDQDRVHVPSCRLPAKPLVYAPFTRSWLTFSYSSTSPQETLQCHHLRHFSHPLSVTSLPPMNGQSTALASSPHHPCILIGNAQGNIFATNYLRSVLPTTTSRAGAGASGYLQKIYEYEFRPDPGQPTPGSSEAPLGEDSDVLFHGPDVRPGISRFTDCFLPEPVTSSAAENAGQAEAGSQSRKTVKAKAKAKRKGKDRAKQEQDEESIVADVIFEEEQACTSLSWNPNQVYAGWAAIGWGSGIVRVMDLSHDAK